jgi:hypothetical protein
MLVDVDEAHLFAILEVFVVVLWRLVSVLP